jgi:hypothetical protein
MAHAHTMFVTAPAIVSNFFAMEDLAGSFNRMLDAQQDGRCKAMARPSTRTGRIKYPRMLRSFSLWPQSKYLARKKTYQPLEFRPVSSIRPHMRTGKGRFRDTPNGRRHSKKVQEGRWPAYSILQLRATAKKRPTT